MISEGTARNLVVRAAASLFYARGIQAVGMDAVRAEAGVSLKRIYTLFPSKSDLVAAVLNHRRAQWESGLEDAAKNCRTPQGKLLAIFDFLRSWVSEGDFRGCAFVNAFGELSGVSPDVAELSRNQKAAFREYVAELVREAGAFQALTDYLVILAEGAQVIAAIDGGVDAVDNARSAAEIVIANALGEL
ncbi:TetR/AcrR family transcriptional regulator [Brevibacterium antiquum]|uniref:TetR/AcrR family transcriptional regulator n=1 Tax=Brevibacterium antiquum TaxID=234835 RepID=UPI0018DF829B|nr:TetR/AcrR family transcriptional regulator [Brevibacterium antiquum]